jgi:hypothetical protein
MTDWPLFFSYSAAPPNNSLSSPPYPPTQSPASAWRRRRFFRLFHMTEYILFNYTIFQAKGKFFYAFGGLPTGGQFVPQ